MGEERDRGVEALFAERQEVDVAAGAVVREEWNIPLHLARPEQLALVERAGNDVRLVFVVDDVDLRQDRFYS